MASQLLRGHSETGVNMFYVLSTVVVKTNTGSTEKYSPRTSNQVRQEISGPFSKRPIAERAALRCLGTHMCVSAIVADEQQLDEMAKKQQGYSLRDMIQKIVVPLRKTVPAFEGQETKV